MTTVGCRAHRARTAGLTLALHHRDPAGTYGDAQAGDPIQYDEFRIEHDQGDREIVYNGARHSADGRAAGDAARPAGGSAR
jgi:hypothetical protein